MRIEQWRDIPGYEGSYQISSVGKIKSLGRSKRDGRNGFHLTKDTIKNPVKRGQYLAIALSKNGHKKTFNIHALVMTCFIGERQKGKEVCHNNGNPHDNRLENLRYGTKAENKQDMRLHGTYQEGEKHGCAKIKDCEAKEIIRLFKLGIKSIILAKMFRVKYRTIWTIVTGRSRIFLQGGLSS
jgi:NUMOD4 motif.